MIKDKSILDLLDKLRIKERGWIIEDNWEADLCAIGIRSTVNFNRMVYINTFQVPDGQYDYECEDMFNCPITKTVYPIRICYESHATFEQLENDLVVFLNNVC